MRRHRICLSLVALIAALSPVQAGTKTWNLAGTGSWTNAGNWFEMAIPAAGDNVYITNASANVILDSPSFSLGSITISNATLTFSNWTTTLTASNVTIKNNGKLTLPSSFTEGQMSNRVYVVCTNFTVEAGGQIMADGRGYAVNNGPGKGGATQESGGGGYGGRGGQGGWSGGTPGATYGSTNAPVDPGSGGGATYGGNPSGGGAVRIDAGGTVTIDGTISANGDSWARYDGAGSGGSIYITCGLFGGSTSGIIRANGGDEPYPGSGGGGGGGRIAVGYTNIIGTPGVRFSVNCGISCYSLDINAPALAHAPFCGTIKFPDTLLMDKILATWGGVADGLNGHIYFDATNVWAPNILVLSNSTLVVPADCGWQITNDLVVSTSRIIVSPHATLTCKESLTLTNNASIVIYSGITNGVYAYGALVEVTKTLTVVSNTWIYPFSDSWNGGSALLRVGNMSILKGGGINADFRGYLRGTGPGKGGSTQEAGGGGYGGKGGQGSWPGGTGGKMYGSTNAPIDPGSGGGIYTYSHNHGGGVVRIESGGAVTIDGVVTANGGSINRYDGGGAGGTIFIICGTFSGGDSGVMRANGGDDPYSGSGGGGGGGRIAVWYNVSPERIAGIADGSNMRHVTITNAYVRFAGTVSVTNGVGYLNPPNPDGAYPGTIVFLTVKRLGSVMRLR